MIPDSTRKVMNLAKCKMPCYIDFESMAPSPTHALGTIFAAKSSNSSLAKPSFWEN